MTRPTRVISTFLLAAPLAVLPACGGSKASVQSKSTTVGQELKDLEDARDRGLITESEYKKQREKIMKGE